MTHDGVTTDQQLGALANAARLLERCGVDYWLFGGWAVDFWVGRVTRDHDDIDLAVRDADREVIVTSLLASGWRREPVDDDAIGAAFRRTGVLLELTFVVTDEDGQVFLPFADGPGLWATTPFGAERRELQGTACRVVSLSHLRADKAAPREDPEDAAKDRHDREVLSHP